MSKKRRRRKYPEATSKRDHYSSVGFNLTTHRAAIQSAINGAKNLNAADFESTDVLGDYYNEYNTKKNDWITQHEQIIIKFENYLTNLDTCIQNAKNLENLWNSRIPIMEEY